jgi:predicted class III extradiol MEMO1 family dioxygenase
MRRSLLHHADYCTIIDYVQQVFKAFLTQLKEVIVIIGFDHNGFGIDLQILNVLWRIGYLIGSQVATYTIIR